VADVTSLRSALPKCSGGHARECPFVRTEVYLGIIRLCLWTGLPVLFEAALLNHDILSHDQPMRGHLAQLGQSAIDMLVGINE